MKFRKHIVTALFIISILLSVLPIHAVNLKTFLPSDLYKKVIWGERISIISYDILAFIIIADDLFRERADYLKKNKYIPLILLTIAFIFATLIVLPKL